MHIRSTNGRPRGETKDETICSGRGWGWHRTGANDVDGKQVITPI